MNQNYQTFYEFGKEINEQVESPFNASNPLTYCLTPTLGSQFMHGSTSSRLLYDTNNHACSSYMSQKCAEKWDGFCEAYQLLNVDTYWPNDAPIDARAFTFAQGFLRNNRPTVGQVLVRNSVNIRFLEYPKLFYSQEPFDPNVANSPLIKRYSNYNTGPSIIKPINNIDKNEHILLMLKNPKVCFDVLARLYLGFARGEKNTRNFHNTILHEYFVENKTMFENFLQQALGNVASYQ